MEKQWPWTGRGEARAGCDVSEASFRTSSVEPHVSEMLQQGELQHRVVHVFTSLRNIVWQDRLLSQLLY